LPPRAFQFALEEEKKNLRKKMRRGKGGKAVKERRGERRGKPITYDEKPILAFSCNDANKFG
jgi:hypothetical protein